MHSKNTTVISDPVKALCFVPHNACDDEQSVLQSFKQVTKSNAVGASG